MCLPLEEAECSQDDLILWRLELTLVLHYAFINRTCGSYHLVVGALNRSTLFPFIFPSDFIPMDWSLHPYVQFPCCTTGFLPKR